MPRRLTGIRLLLVFLGINLVMILMLVTSLTRAHPWLGHVLPGHFESGGNSSGYWVFFALVLLVDAVTVFIAGLGLMLPAMLEGAPADERRLTRHLVDRGGVSEAAKEAIFVALREEAVNTHYQVIVGRMILVAGALFLVVAFFSVSLAFARALPDGQMFLQDGDAVKNAFVTMQGFVRYTADQVVAAVALNAPEIYGVRFTSLANNPAYPLFTHFIFAFRTLIGFTLVLVIISLLRRPQRPKAEKKTIQSVEAKLAEEKK